MEVFDFFFLGRVWGSAHGSQLECVSLMRKELTTKYCAIKRSSALPWSEIASPAELRRVRTCASSTVHLYLPCPVGAGLAQAGNDKKGVIIPYAIALKQ
jgi:hypothetical protein